MEVLFHSIKLAVLAYNISMLSA